MQYTYNIYIPLLDTLLIPMKNSKRFPQRLTIVCVGLVLATSLIFLVPNTSAAAGSQI